MTSKKFIMIIKILKKLHEIKRRFIRKYNTKICKLLFGSFGKKSVINGKIILINPKNIYFGKNSSLNIGALLNASTIIKIGNYVHISSYCIINTGGLNYKKIMSERHHIVKPVTIEDGVWI